MDKKVVKKAVAPAKKMFKVVKKVARPRVVEVGERVTVTTVYTVKRMPSALEGRHPNAMVSVEDKYGDRVLNFRLEELKLEE